MKHLLQSFALIMSLFFVIFFGCQSKPDFEALRAEILDLHKTMIDAHLEKNIGFFTRDISDDYFSVGNGEIRNPDIESVSEQFTDYLNNTTFSRYEDLQEPIIGFSEDGSLAWSIVNLRVEGERKIENDSIYDFGTTWAWITLYKHEGDKWIRMGEVSSYK